MSVMLHFKNVVLAILLFKYSILFLFSSLLDLWVFDYLGINFRRFFIGYRLLSVFYDRVVYLFSNFLQSMIMRSLVSFFYSAGWLEREAWDLYGLFFMGNFDLRRILTDYGFTGFPLRKDFPLVGFYQVRYFYDFKCILNEYVELLQDLRWFKFTSPWIKV